MTVFFLLTMHRTGFFALKIFSIFSLLYSPMYFSFNMIRFSPSILKSGELLLIEGDTFTFN